MTDRRDDNELLDARLRRALAADAPTVARVTRGALAAGGAAGAGRLGGWLSAAALVAAGLALAVLLTRSPGGPAAEAPAAAAAVRISNHGEVLAVQGPAGRLWLGHHPDGPIGRGPRLVIRKGEADG